jgi:hypothetical protein
MITTKYLIFHNTIEKVTTKYLKFYNTIEKVILMRNQCTYLEIGKLSKLTTCENLVRR